MPELGKQDVNDVLNGLGDGYIHLLYKISYRDIDGNKKDFLVDDIYFMVTNCGYVQYNSIVNCLRLKRIYSQHEKECRYE